MYYKNVHDLVAKHLRIWVRTAHLHISAPLRRHSRVHYKTAWNHIGPIRPECFGPRGEWRAAPPAAIYGAAQHKCM